MGIIRGGTSPLPLVNSPGIHVIRAINQRQGRCTTSNLAISKGENDEALNREKPENSPKWGIAPKCSKYNVSTSEHDDT